MILVGLAACDGGPTRLLPGPCSASQGRMSCTYTYDDLGRPVDAICDFRVTETELEMASITAAWTYDGDAFAGYRRVTDFEYSGIDDQAWTIGATEVTRQLFRSDGVYWQRRDDVYEVDGFALVGQPYDLETSPISDDRLTSMHRVNGNAKDDTMSITDHTYTYDPATVPTDGTRVQTRDDGDFLWFTYQDGRLHDDEVTTYTWNGDRLTGVENGILDVTYHYDAFGNLMERRDEQQFEDGPRLFVTTFDYGCWE